MRNPRRSIKSLRTELEPLFPGPVPHPVLPVTTRERLERKIAEDQAFIEKYPNYPWLCEEAERRIRYNQAELDKLPKEAA